MEVTSRKPEHASRSRDLLPRILLRSFVLSAALLSLVPPTACFGSEPQKLQRLTPSGGWMASLGEVLGYAGAGVRIGGPVLGNHVFSVSGDGAAVTAPGQTVEAVPGAVKKHLRHLRATPLTRLQSAESRIWAPKVPPELSVGLGAHSGRGRRTLIPQAQAVGKASVVPEHKAEPPAAGQVLNFKGEERKTGNSKSNARGERGGCSMVVGAGGRFQKVQDAVDSIGQNTAATPVTVCIKAGTYREQVHVQPGQDGIKFFGEGIDTVIRASSSLSKANNTFLAATLVVQGNHFTARNLLIMNSRKTVKDPAPAVSLLAGNSRWDHVSLIAWDDTVAVYTGAHLFTSCFISGITDITWGFGRAAFVDTTILIRDKGEKQNKGEVATFGTGEGSNGVPAGALFWNCTIDGPGTAFLGRPYRQAALTVFAYCFLGRAVMSNGWVDHRQYLESKQYRFEEYMSWGPGASARRQYGEVFQKKPPEEFGVSEFLSNGS